MAILLKMRTFVSRKIKLRKNYKNMSSIQIKKVTNKTDLKNFIDLHYELYAGSPYDVPNLYDDFQKIRMRLSNSAKLNIF